jgi:hypothetical protein
MSFLLFSLFSSSSFFLFLLLSSQFFFLLFLLAGSLFLSSFVGFFLLSTHLGLLLSAGFGFWVTLVILAIVNA